MSSLGKTGDARGVNAFVSGETSRIVDAFPEMAEWFEKDAAAERRKAKIETQLISTGGQILKRGLLNTLFKK